MELFKRNFLFRFKGNLSTITNLEPQHQVGFGVCFNSKFFNTREIKETGDFNVEFRFPFEVESLEDVKRIFGSERIEIFLIQIPNTILDTKTHDKQEESKDPKKKGKTKVVSKVKGKGKKEEKNSFEGFLKEIEGKKLVLIRNETEINLKFDT